MNASQTTPRPREGADDEPEQPPSPSERAHIDVADDTGDLSDDDIARLRSLVGAAVAAAVPSQDGDDVRVRVVTDARMSELHERHSGVEGTTDVLTFDLRDDPSGALDVDLVVCVDEARRAAGERGHDVVEELTLYALHGVLHCAGYDDHSDDGFRAMHELEDEILRGLGLRARFFGADQ